MKIDTELQDITNQISILEAIEEEARKLGERIERTADGGIDDFKQAINIMNARLDGLYKEKGRIEREIRRRAQKS
jgi:hypothetical protein